MINLATVEPGAYVGKGIVFASNKWMGERWNGASWANSKAWLVEMHGRASRHVSSASAGGRGWYGSASCGPFLAGRVGGVVQVGRCWVG